MSNEAILGEIPIGLSTLHQLFVANGDQNGSEEWKTAGNTLPPDAE